MHTLSVGDSIRFAWATFKKRPWFFVGIAAFIVLVSGIISRLTPSQDSAAFMLVAIGFFISAVINVFLKMGTINLLLKAHDAPSSARFGDLWAPDQFWNYVGAAIISGVIIVIGFILLIVPGIYFALRFLFVPYLVVDRKLSPMDALKESSRITKGQKGALLLLLLALLALNILGAIALVVGLLVTIPMTMLSIVHAYRTLEHRASEVSVS